MKDLRKRYSHIKAGKKIEEMSSGVAKAVCIGCDSADFCQKPCAKYRKVAHRMLPSATIQGVQLNRVIPVFATRGADKGRHVLVGVIVGIRPTTTKVNPKTKNGNPPEPPKKGWCDECIAPLRTGHRRGCSQAKKAVRK